jgi:putative hydrolase of the HAD superfamily
MGAAAEADEEVSHAPPLRAVIFDLWNTLAEWPVDEWAATRPRVAERLGLSWQEFEERWFGDLATMRETGPMADALRILGASPEVAADVASMRRAVTAQGLVPVPGSIETIAELRRRGFRIGLITVCTDDVPALWPETPFHGLFDAEVFSCSVGLKKPDPRIYLLACEQLGVEPQEAMFVGDGANDELAGAERVGLRAILLEREGEELEWTGLRVRSLPELLSRLP